MSTTINLDELITVEQAAATLGVSAATVRNLAKAGDLTIVNIGPRAARLNRPAVEALAATRTHAR